MRKRSDFSKDEWKKEDGNIRSCWSCKGDDQAQTKDCNKCSHSKVKSFFTKQEWANATIHVCNECKKEKSVVKKVKAPEGVETKTDTEVITKVMKGVRMKSPKETDLKAPNEAAAKASKEVRIKAVKEVEVNDPKEIETKAFKEVKKTTSKELKTKAPKEVEAEVPILKKKKLTK